MSGALGVEVMQPRATLHRLALHSMRTHRLDMQVEAQTFAFIVFADAGADDLPGDAVADRRR